VSISRSRAPHDHLEVPKSPPYRRKKIRFVTTSLPRATTRFRPRYTVFACVLHRCLGCFRSPKRFFSTMRSRFPSIPVSLPHFWAYCMFHSLKAVSLLSAPAVALRGSRHWSSGGLPYGISLSKSSHLRPKIEKISPNRGFPTYIQTLLPGLGRFIDIDARNSCILSGDRDGDFQLKI